MHPYTPPPPKKKINKTNNGIIIFSILILSTLTYKYKYFMAQT